MLLVFVTTAPASAGDRDTPNWNQDQAAKYLDSRAKEWFEYSSADRGREQNKTSCVSCHTLLPYALARPVLRKLSDAAQPAALESELVGQIKKRVEHWNELDAEKYGLLYSFDEQKKKESRGTEAVISSLVLARLDRAEGRKEPSEFTQKALSNLWQVQVAEGEQKGSWTWLDFGSEPWEAKGSRYWGAALAAVAVGTAPGYYAPGRSGQLDEKVESLRSYLHNHLAAQNLHNRLGMLWASTQLDNLLKEEEQNQVVRAVFAKQQADGGWSLPSLGTFTRKDGTPQATDSDGYATGLVLHVLQTAGVPKSDARVARGLSWLKSHQAATGAWLTSSVNKKRNPATHIGKFMSDAATAYAVLALSH
jgi:squalene-hopene/tetraprenyl-beta-curcumene cyclase